jgi:hypothetical protein
MHMVITRRMDFTAAVITAVTATHIGAEAGAITAIEDTAVTAIAAGMDTAEGTVIAEDMVIAEIMVIAAAVLPGGAVDFAAMPGAADAVNQLREGLAGWDQVKE